MFANHYDEIHSQCLLYLAKQQAGIEEQKEREAEKKERDAVSDEVSMALAEFLNSDDEVEIPEKEEDESLAIYVKGPDASFDDGDAEFKVSGFDTGDGSANSDDDVEAF